MSELDQCIVLSFQQDTKRLKVQRSFLLSIGSETIKSEGFPNFLEVTKGGNPEIVDKLQGQSTEDEMYFRQN